MIYELEIKEEARFDISESYQWYESKSKGLGEEFLNALDDYFNDISKSPEHYQIRKNNRRYCPMKRFPFVIVYEIESRKIIVYAVFHTHRNPFIEGNRK